MAVSDDKKETTKILGMSKTSFYGISGVLVFLVGYGVYKIIKGKK